MQWKPVNERKKMSRRKYVGDNKRRKWEYQCGHCGGWFSDNEIEVDHIVEAGSLRSFEDLAGFCERLFCEVDGLECLCKECHKKKTHA
jgi:5-methylcytosine-specific restriction endonuclease McrA